MVSLQDLRDRETKKYGKWASDKVDRPTPHVYQPVENQQDIDHLRNAMAKGNYPAGILDCEVVGINGDCGAKCPVLIRGECPNPQGED